MKKSYIPFALILAVATSGSVAFAQELAISATSTTKADVKTKNASTSADVKITKTVATTSATSTKLQNVKKKLDEMAKKRVDTLVSKVERKFSNALDRLIKIDAKIETRIGKFEDMGVDVAETKTLLTKARADLLAAQSKFTQLPGIIETQLKSEEVSKEAIKKAVTEVKESLKTAHASYVKVVASLKAKNGVKAGQNGTSTKATTTSTTTVKVKTSATSTNN